MTAAGVTSQIFVGGAAMVVATNTAHPLRLATNRFVNATSLTIEASGAVVCNSSMCNTSDSRLKDDQQIANLSTMQTIFDSIEAKTYTRNDLGGQKRMGFIAQDIEAAMSGHESYKFIVGEGSFQRNEDSEVEAIKTVDYSRMTCVLWGVVKNMQKRIDDLESKLS